MGKYIITSGQNIYDVALHIYGSIEGIVDLMMNNTNLSLCDTFKADDELFFTDDFVINNDIVSYYRMNGITPSNGERSVYYKTSDYPKLLEIYIDKDKTLTEFIISGSGVIDIDWGDNTPIQTLHLLPKEQNINHFFDNAISKQRRIRFYGNVSIQLIDLSLINAKSIFFNRPVYIEKLILKESNFDISFFHLLDGTYKIDLTKIKTNDLLPLLSCKKLMELNLSGGVFNQIVLDHYLISLVTQYYGRRNCTINLTMSPSGEYKEPKRDDKSNYIINTGMEAIWLLVNEPAWNEAGKWKFIINGQVFCKP